MSNSEKNPGRLYFKCPKRECKFFQWADVEPRGCVKNWLEGKPTPGESRASHHLSNDRMIKDHVIWEHEAEPIPFDQALWEECQKQKFIMTDSFNIIAVTCELQGKRFLRNKEKELRKELYLLHLIARINKEASEQSQKEH